jgi:UDP-N-acetylmuramoyl-L-alanyl-D-glutamate--2,6-diaminopimelate ligase
MSARAISVAELLRGRADAGAAGGIVVHGLGLDSRTIRAGEAFVALSGTRSHGITFAPAASARGAAVVLADPAGLAASASTTALQPGRANRKSGIAQDIGNFGSGDFAVPVVWVEGLREALGAIASRFYGEPSQALEVIGVTGTNGKTSTVQLLAQALQHAGHVAATIGTLGAGLYGAVREGERTTPDAIAVHGLLAAFRDAGASHVAMEVSSHALDQGRVNAVAFDLAVFTNLTRDHLDYHGTMAAYGAAKQRLFEWPGLAAAVINVDDAFGRVLASRLPGSVRRLRCGIERDDAEVVARALEGHAGGLAFHLSTPWGEAHVRSRLLGRFNVSNLLAVAACLGALGVPFDRLVAALDALEPVAGRMSRLGGSGAQPLVVVDYAHTPDALEQALTSLRAHCSGRLSVVFGCGGERDAGKRPEMGVVAESLADRVVVTDDNPRGEDGDAIIEQILGGLRRPAQARVVRDRAAAIALAIGEAQPGDVVLVAGKGHEPYQEIAGARRPFDDLDVARRALGARAC